MSSSSRKSSCLMPASREQQNLCIIRKSGTDRANEETSICSHNCFYSYCILQLMLAIHTRCYKHLERKLILPHLYMYFHTESCALLSVVSHYSIMSVLCDRGRQIKQLFHFLSLPFAKWLTLMLISADIVLALALWLLPGVKMNLNASQSIII